MKAQTKATKDRLAEALRIARERYRQLREERPILIREEDARAFGGPAGIDDRHRPILIKELAPPWPGREGDAWRVIVGGADTWNHSLVRVCKNEADARRVYGAVHDWTTARTLRNRGFVTE